MYSVWCYRAVKCLRGPKELSMVFIYQCSTLRANMHGPREKVTLLLVYFLTGQNRGWREEGAEAVQVVV